MSLSVGATGVATCDFDLMRTTPTVCGVLCSWQTVGPTPSVPRTYWRCQSWPFSHLCWGKNNGCIFIYLFIYIFFWRWGVVEGGMEFLHCPGWFYWFNQYNGLGWLHWQKERLLCSIGFCCYGSSPFNDSHKKASIIGPDQNKQNAAACWFNRGRDPRFVRLHKKS